MLTASNRLFLLSLATALAAVVLPCANAQTPPPVGQGASQPRPATQKVDAYLGALAPSTSFEKLASGNDLLLEPPSVAASGSIPVKIKSTIPQTDRMWLLSLSPQLEGPSVLLASLELTPTAKPEAVLHLNLQRTQNILLVVRANGKYYGLQRQVKIGQIENKK